MSRRRRRRLHGVAACALLLALATVPTAVAQVRVAGLQVVGPGAGRNGTELQAFRERPGTTVVLLLSAPEGKSIIELDDDGSAVSSWTDDEGTNLLESVRWDPFGQVTEDGSLGLIEVSSEARPAAGATTIKVVGEVALQVATGTDSETVPSLRAEVGQKVETKQGALEVVAVEIDDSMTLTLQANTTIRDSIRDVRFFDGEEEIEVSGRGSMSMGNSVQLEYYLERAAERLRVELDWWIGLESIKMPFEVETGLGLAQ